MNWAQFKDPVFHIYIYVSCWRHGIIRISYTRCGRFEPFWCDNNFFCYWIQWKHLGKTPLMFVQFLTKAPFFVITKLDSGWVVRLRSWREISFRMDESLRHLMITQSTSAFTSQLLRNINPFYIPVITEWGKIKSMASIKIQTCRGWLQYIFVRNFDFLCGSCGVLR